MRSYPQRKRYGFVLGATLVLGAAGAFAATPAPPEPAKELTVQVQVPASTSAPSTSAPSASAPSTSAAPMVDPAAGHLSTEAGVRRAAAQGIDTLRRYVERTRIIYNYRVVDFALPQ